MRQKIPEAIRQKEGRNARKKSQSQNQEAALGKRKPRKAQRKMCCAASCQVTENARVGRLGSYCADLCAGKVNDDCDGVAAPR
jgi:hypothetical protein